MVSSCSGPPIQPTYRASWSLGVAASCRPKVLPTLLSMLRFQPLTTNGLERDRVASLNRGAEAGVEQRLSEPVDDAARVVLVELAVGDFGTVDGVELAEIERQHAFRAARSPRGVGLFHEFEPDVGVAGRRSAHASGVDFRRRTEAQVDRAADRIGIDARVQADPGQRKAVGRRRRRGTCSLPGLRLREVVVEARSRRRRTRRT